MAEKQLRTEKLKLEFLNQLHKTGGNVLRSCEIVGASRAKMLRHYEKDDKFRATWDSAVKGKLIQKDVDSSLINQAKPSVFDISPSMENSETVEPERLRNAEASDLTKLNISDLTKLDLSEDENLRKPHISESENSTKLHIQNDISTDCRNEKSRNFDTNSEFEKASKSKQFSTENVAETENDANGESAQSAQSLKKENELMTAPIRMPVRRPLSSSHNQPPKGSRPVMRLRPPEETESKEG